MNSPLQITCHQLHRRGEAMSELNGMTVRTAGKRGIGSFLDNRDVSQKVGKKMALQESIGGKVTMMKVEALLPHVTLTDFMAGILFL